MKRCPKCQSIYSDEVLDLCPSDGALLEYEHHSIDESQAASPAGQPDSPRRYKYDVFISYASADSEPVKRLVQRLKQDSFRIWIDQEQMGGGNVVFSALAEGLQNSAHVIVCLSEAYIKRDYTRLELDMNQSLDPSGALNRTIPVIVGQVGEVPLQIAGLVRRDLTNPARYEVEYELLTRNIRRVQGDTAAPATNDLALEALRRACRVPFQRLDEPYVALFLVQRAVKALGMFLYRRETGQPPSDLTFDALTERLHALGKLPPDIDLSLVTVRKYSSIVINEQAEEISITHESIKPGLEALKVLVRWTFMKYFAYDLSEVEKLWAEARVAEPLPPPVAPQLLSPLEEPQPTPEQLEVEKPELPPPPPRPSDFFLQFEIAVESQSAWPLAAQRVLVWEKVAGALSVWGNAEVLWRDSFPLHLRRVAMGPNNQLCVGSWEGRVRCFADGMLAVAIDLLGAIGDIQFCAGRWIAGTWKHSLMSITSDYGAIKLPPKVANGVFRIAAMKDADWFAIADLRGGIALYKERRRVVTIPPFGSISSMAFAGRRLMVLAGDSLYGVGLDGQVGPPERLLATEKASLLPSSSPDCCLLLARQGSSWEINNEGILLPYFNLPAGHRILSYCYVPKRFTVALPEQGCAYWRDGKQQQVWPKATTAHLSPDGRFVTVVFPDKVQLYEDPR
jgi:hypothetical protein